MDSLINASKIKAQLEKQREHFYIYNAPLIKEEYKDQDSLLEERTLSEEESDIIQSYPARLHHLFKELVRIFHVEHLTSSFSEEELSNFRHNMRHLFVDVNSYVEGWPPADLKTLWADGWRESDIIGFMISKKVKYILCHDHRIIQCLNLEGTLSKPSVYVFEKKKQVI